MPSVSSLTATAVDALRRGVLTLWFCLIAVTDASAVLLYDSNNPATNTTAPTGDYVGSGWAFQGLYGSYLGTMIAPQYFITAAHFPIQGNSFVSTSAFNGVADVTYTIDSAANGGQGYWDIAGTDLRILKINETFSSYASLYTGSDEVGKTMVLFGRGGVRGADVTLGAELRGWLHGAQDNVPRWGANVVSGVAGSGVGPLLAARFDAISGQQEAGLSIGDSGGGVFINSGGQWFLAGINYGFQGLFDTNNTIDDSEFSASLFDAGGFYWGSDGGGWNQIPDGVENVPSEFYSSRISDNLAAIQAIAGVPEPGPIWLLAVTMLVSLRTRFRSAGSLPVTPC